MKDTRPFWATYRDWYFELSTLTTGYPLKKDKDIVWSDGHSAFRELDIKGNFDYIEEALWAARNGLSD